MALAGRRDKGPAPGEVHAPALHAERASWSARRRRCARPGLRVSIGITTVELTVPPVRGLDQSVISDRYAGMMLNNRDWASIIWLAVLAAFVLRDRAVRSSLRALAHAFFKPVILLPVAGMGAYVIGLVLLARRFDLWSVDLLKDTIIWFIATGFVLFINVSRSAQRGFFRSASLDAAKATVFLEFFLNLMVFSLPVELLLLPVVFLATAIPIVARGNPANASVVRFMSFVSSALGLGIGTYVVWKIVTKWHEVARVDTLRGLALPIWLTLGLLPFVYVLSLWVNYGSAFTRVDIATDDGRARRRVKIALLITLNVRTTAAGSFAWPWIGQAIDTTSLRQARRVIKNFRTERRVEREDGPD